VDVQRYQQWSVQERFRDVSITLPGFEIMSFADNRLQHPRSLRKGRNHPLQVPRPGGGALGQQSRPILPRRPSHRGRRPSLHSQFNHPSIISNTANRHPNNRQSSASTQSTSNTSSATSATSAADIQLFTSMFRPLHNPPKPLEAPISLILLFTRTNTIE
jgi:hypothetical protein